MMNDECGMKITRILVLRTPFIIHHSSFIIVR